MPHLIFTTWPGIAPDDAPTTIERMGDVEPDGLWFRAIGTLEGDLVVFELWSDLARFRRYRDRAMGRDSVKALLESRYKLRGPGFAFRTSVTATYPGLVRESPRSEWVELKDDATVALFVWPAISLVQYREVVGATRGVLAHDSADELLFAADGPYGDAGWVVAHAWRRESARQAHVEHTREMARPYVAGGPELKRVAQLRYAYYTASCPTELSNQVCPEGIA